MKWQKKYFEYSNQNQIYISSDFKKLPKTAGCVIYVNYEIKYNNYIKNNNYLKCNICVKYNSYLKCNICSKYNNYIKNNKIIINN